MVRVLQLLDRGRDFQADWSAAALAREAGAGFSITSHTIGAPGNSRGAFVAFAMLRWGTGQRPDVIHAWGLQALAAAVLAGKAPILFTPTEHATPRSTFWLRSLMRRGNVRMACGSGFEQDYYIRLGLLAERCHLVRPGIDLDRLQTGRDDRLRAAMGIAPHDYVMLAVGESTRAAGHRDSLWPASILHVLDTQYRLLLWGRGGQTDALVRLAAHLHQPTLLAAGARADLAARRGLGFDALLGAADLALVTSRDGVATLPIALCMAAKIPILATPSAVAKEMLWDGQTAVVVPRRSSRLVAQRVLELREDPATAHLILQNAQAEARARFSMDRFVEEHRALYRMLDGSA